MYLLNWRFLSITIFILLIEVDFGLSNPWKIWNSNAWSPGSRDKGLKFLNVSISNFGSEKEINKWQAIKTENGYSVLGLGKDFLKITRVGKDDRLYSMRKDMDHVLSHMAVYQRWSATSHTTENFIILASHKNSSEGFLNWYQFYDEDIVHLWSSPFNRNITHMDVMTFDYESKIIIVSNSNNSLNNVTVDICSFSLGQGLDMWLCERFPLEDNPSTVQMTHCNIDIFLVFTFFKMEMVFIYKYYESFEDYGHFKLYRKIKSKDFTGSVSFCFGFISHLAVASSHSALYKIGGNLELIPSAKISFVSREHWLVIPLGIYKKDLMLLAEGKNGVAVFFMSRSDMLELSKNMADIVCSSDNNCNDEFKYFSVEHAETFSYNGYHYIVYTSKLGDSKILKFKTQIVTEKDGTNSQLDDINSYKMLLEKQWMELTTKIQVLEEEIQNISDQINSTQTVWAIEHVKVQEVKVEENPNSSISNFEYAHNKRWVASDYSVYLDLMSEPRSKNMLSNEIENISQYFPGLETSKTIENISITDLEADDISFLGSVTVNHLHVIYLNGIEVEDMLQNSVMLGSTRKIGGVKTVTDFSADNILFDQLNGISKHDIMFSDELEENRNRNIVNGILIFENDVGIVNELEVLPAEENRKLIYKHLFNHGFTFMDKIIFEHLVITNDSFVEETLNGRPLILPVHNSPFEVFSLNSVNQVRIELVKVQDQLNIGFINDRVVSEVCQSEKKINSSSKNFFEFSADKWRIDYLNNIKFPEGFIAENQKPNLTLNFSKNFTGRIITKKLYLEDEKSVTELKNRISTMNITEFDNIDIRGALYTEIINDYSWNQITNILNKANQESVSLTGEKMFGKTLIAGNITIKGELNSHRADNIMNRVSDQVLTYHSLNDVLFLRLNVSETFDGMFIKNVKETTVRLSENKNYDNNLNFSPKWLPKFKQLMVVESNKKIKSFGQSIQEKKYGDIIFNIINTTNVIINGCFISNDQITNLKKFYKSSPQTEGLIKNKNNQRIQLNSSQKLKSENLNREQLRQKEAIAILGNKLVPVRSIFVKGHVKTENGINGYNLTDFANNAVSVTKNNIIHDKILFDDIVTFYSLKINERWQGIPLKRLQQDLIFDSSYVFLKAPKNFYSNITVFEKMKTRSMNGHLLQKTLTKNGDNWIKGPLMVKGNVTVTGNITSYGPMDLLKNYSFKHNSYIITNDVELHIPRVDHIIVDGTIYNENFSSIIDEVVTIDDDSYIKAKKVILGPVNFNESMKVEDTLNGLNITQFNSDIVLINGDDIILRDVIISKTIMHNVVVTNDFNSTYMHGYDTHDWLEESIPLGSSVSISGGKKFKNIHCFDDIKTDFINDHLSFGIIPLRKDQFIPCTGFFHQINTVSDITVGRWVNGKVLTIEFGDTVLFDEDGQVIGPLTFTNEFLVEGDVIFESNENRRRLDVITLYSEQLISSELIFEDSVVANNGIDNLSFINGVDILEWSKKSIALHKSQVVRGSWIINGNISVQQDIHGKVLLDSVNVSDVSKSIKKVKMLIMDVGEKIQSDFHRQCELLSNLSHQVALQPNILHNFEISQILKASVDIKSVITFKANNNHYALLTFYNECLSILYQWNDIAQKFTKAVPIHIGPVDKWLTLYYKNATYLITSSLNSDLICEKNSKRGNIWLFDGDHDRYGHLFTTEGFSDIIKSENSPENFYTLGMNGDVLQWTLEPRIFSQLIINIGNDQYEFLDYGVLGKIAFTNGRNIIDINKKVIHTFEKPCSGRIITITINGKALTLVPYHEELVIYENLIQNKVYAYLPASNVGSIIWLNSGSKRPYLLFETQQKSFHIVHFKGTQGTFEKVSVPLHSQNLFLTMIPRKEDLRPKEFIFVVQNKKILLLEVHYIGNLYKERDLNC